MDILNTYSFQVVALGTIILAITSSVVGSINVYKGQSLIGDAMGHSTLAGIILAYMLFETRNPVVLLVGAMISASVSYYLIEYTSKSSKISLDSGMAIYLSGFFGLGLMLKTFIQGNSNYIKASQSDLDKYIFGQASYLLEYDVVLIAISALVCTSLLILNYKEFNIYLFDKEFATLSGVNVKKLDMISLFMTILNIGIGIKAVGVILISSFLIIPTVSARQWTNKYFNNLVIAAIFSIISSFLGSYISTKYTGFSTGPVITVISGIIFTISILMGKNGILKRRGI